MMFKYWWLSHLNVREEAQISQKSESRDGNPIVRDDSSDDSVFLLDVAHAAADAEES